MHSLPCNVRSTGHTAFHKLFVYANIAEALISKLSKVRGLTKRESRAMLSLTCSRAGNRLLLVEQLTL